MNDGGPSPRILLTNRQTLPVDQNGLIELARATLIGEGRPASELSVAFVTAEEMADLHRQYMGEPGPTDVLSFPLEEEDEGGVMLLGDVVIAPSVAAANNRDDPAGELRLLLVHGILHLLGHDHQDADERRTMWEIQERYSGVSVS
jgi:probable rRNA maturation factor